MSELRYAALQKGREKKLKWFPELDPDWQAREYECLMGRPPPENQDSWQWAYNPRTKASKQAFKEFIS